MVEMFVACAEYESVLENERRDPPIVGGDRCALVPELPVHHRIMVRRLLIRE
jgi:hypothetical protein